VGSRPKSSYSTWSESNCIDDSSPIPFGQILNETRAGVQSSNSLVATTNSDGCGMSRSSLCRRDLIAGADTYRIDNF
jgi:hypothetical protein